MHADLEFFLPMFCPILLSTLHYFVVHARSQFSDTWAPTSVNLLAEKLMYYKHWLGADWG